ncbi:MAG TPA: DUF4350 domain-containing protein [Pyrinomonadaceae bacterium]|jgi:hypothetical protein
MKNVFAILLLTASALCVLSPSKAAAQEASQVPDPNFDTKVERPAYTKKRPRVMFDEAHFNVHTTATGYRAFAEMMANDGYRITPNRGKFARNTLKGFRVLVIANALGAANPDDPDAARPAFTKEECDAVRDWVRGGGALLLITDHEPAASAAENLATRFEVGTGKNFAVDKSNYFTRTGWAGNLVFSRGKGLLAEHPIINGRDAAERINQVLTFGGQSLTGPADSTAFLKLSDTAKTLFAYPARQVEISAADRAQGIALKYGRGRVVITGEAGMLSAQILKEGQASYPFGMNVPGFDNRQLALNIMHWLSGLLG